MENLELWYRSRKNGLMYSADGGTLTFVGDGRPLTNWTITGAEGGVGVRTKNLADTDAMLQGYWANSNGGFVSSRTWVCTPKTPCAGNTAYTLRFDNVSRWYGFVWFDANDNFISVDLHQEAYSHDVRFTATSPANAAFFGVDVADEWNGKGITKENMLNFQVEQSSAATDFEPYGYKIVVLGCESEEENAWGGYNHIDRIYDIYIGNSLLGSGESISFGDTGVEIKTLAGTENDFKVINSPVEPERVSVTVAGMPDGLRAYLRQRYPGR